MAKKKGKKASAKAAAVKDTPVICFFFYGKVDQLGDELAKAFTDAGISDTIVNLASAFAPPKQ